MDLDGIRHLATLAELSLSAEEELRLGDEIGRILAYVAELDAIDTSGVEPTAQIAVDLASAALPLRPDEVVPGLTHDEALAEAPRVDRDGFSVPTFVE